MAFFREKENIFLLIKVSFTRDNGTKAYNMGKEA
jgi:hypothetical protein